MAESIFRTQDGSLFETWTQAPAQHEQTDARLEPRLRLLYHVDLDRIGALSAADSDLKDGAWLTVGRRAPMFFPPGSAAGRPLDDPTISREQLRLRWLASEQLFEIEPAAGARRKLGLVTLDTGDITEITEPVQVTPGVCLAIENRVLLGLELTTPRTPDAQRLGLVGESETMWQLRDDIRSVAGFGRPALVTGPTGAGKELVARAIHEHGPRADAPFITVNCAALPEQLVESLLFGHRRGAFTGAESDRTGAFREADGGALFLDELGEMPILVQPKLLRTIQDGMVTAVGQHKSVSVDVRLIAATNRDLEQEVAAERMRADLYHRLAGHIVRVPPLAARRFDIPALFRHFLAALRDDHPGLAWLWDTDKRWKKTIPMPFILDLLRCEWPGNVREMQNIAERCARLNVHGGPFRPPVLPVGAAPSSATPASTSPISGPTELDKADIPPAASEPAISESGAPGVRLGQASELLELAHKTVAKLFDAAALDRVWSETQPGGDDAPEDHQAALRTALRAGAADRLFALLEEHDFKQRRVAAALGISPSTLIKLMQRFGLPRPADLTYDTIQTALDRTDGDLTAAAAVLRVSPQGLKKRLTLLNLERQKP